MIYILIFIVAIFILFLPIQYFARKKMMKSLASEFNLKYDFGMKKLSDYFRFDRDWKINHIKGILNNHQIHIYDFVSSAEFLGITAFDSYSHTVIKVDDKIINNGNQYKSFRLVHVMSIGKIRNILKSIAQKDL